MLQREHELGYRPDQRTLAYNGGPIPLAEHIPNIAHPGASFDRRRCAPYLANLHLIARASCKSLCPV